MEVCEILNGTLQGIVPISRVFGLQMTVQFFSRVTTFFIEATPRIPKYPEKILLLHDYWVSKLCHLYSPKNFQQGNCSWT